jgi:hypothetical protein
LGIPVTVYLIAQVAESESSKLSSESHLSLYRGINRIDEHETLGGGRYRVLFNNLNSFTSSRERENEFGDYILIAEVPLPMIFFFNRLLPGMLKGEDEFVVLGGSMRFRSVRCEACAGSLA